MRRRAGAWVRWLLGLALNPLVLALPLGTLAANLIGGYLVGVAVGVFHLNTHYPLAWKLFAITGLPRRPHHPPFHLFRRSRRAPSGRPACLGHRPAAVHLAGSLLATHLGLLTVGATRIWG